MHFAERDSECACLLNHAPGCMSPRSSTLDGYRLQIGDWVKTKTIPAARMVFRALAATAAGFPRVDRPPRRPSTLRFRLRADPPLPLEISNSFVSLRDVEHDLLAFGIMHSF